MRQLKYKLLFISLFTIYLSQVFAQDKIVKRDGTVINGYVKEVNTNVIHYSKQKDAGSLIYSIGRAAVNQITYENGEVEIINPIAVDPGYKDRREPAGANHRHSGKINPKGKNGKPVYGYNIVTIAPLMNTFEQITDYMGAPQIGASYERVLDKSGRITAYLPVGITFRNNLYDASRMYFSDNFSYSVTNSGHVINFAPGARFAPGGTFKRAGYAVGASFQLSMLALKGERYELLNGNPVSVTDFKGTLVNYGFTINHSFNFQPTPQFYWGIEGGMGMSFSQNLSGFPNNNNDNGGNPILRFMLKAGYRF